MTNLKKVLTAAVMTTLLLVGTTSSYAGIIVAGFGDSDSKEQVCTAKSDGGSLAQDAGGIIVAGLTGIIVAGLTGIIVAGAAETPTNCGIIVAG